MSGLGYWAELLVVSFQQKQRFKVISFLFYFFEIIIRECTGIKLPEGLEIRVLLKNQQLKIGG